MNNTDTPKKEKRRNPKANKTSRGRSVYAYALIPGITPRMSPLAFCAHSIEKCWSEGWASDSHSDALVTHA